MEIKNSQQFCFYYLLCNWKVSLKPWIVSQDSSHDFSVLTMFRNHQQIHRVILHFLSTSQTEVCCWFVCLWKFLQHIKLVPYQHRATATVQHRIYCWCCCLNSWLMGNRGTTSSLSLLLLYVIHRCINPCLPAKHRTSFHILSPHPESGIMSHFQSKSVLISWSWCDDIFFFYSTCCLVSKEEKLEYYVEVYPGANSAPRPTHWRFCLC